MKGRAAFVCTTTGLVLSVIALAGCRPNQQEKLELQKTIDVQEARIAELEESGEELIILYVELAADLKACEKRLAATERENILLKKAREFTPGELQKGLAELKAAREAAAKRLREEAAAEANEP
jgi:vacuolar-type H+-ATPase subunit I/STV1